MVSPASGQSTSFGASVSAGILVVLLFAGTAASWSLLPHSSTAHSGVLLVLWMNVFLILGVMAGEARRRPYSLHMMHLLALFLFLGAAPVFQYSRGAFGVAGPIALVRGQVLPCALAVTLWILAYTAAYETNRALQSPQRRGPVVRFLHRPVTPLRTLLVLVLGLGSLAYLAAIGLAGAATRGAVIETLGAEHGARRGEEGLVVVLIQGQLLRAFSLVALLTAVLIVARDRRARSPVLIALILVVAAGTLLANNPFAASRMWFATTLIAFLAPFVLRRMKTSWGLVLIALGGLAFLPALGETRNMETFAEFAEYFEQSLVSPLAYLSQSSDVDSLGMLTLVYQWTEIHGHRWGMQMLGALLFWFPRMFWPGKPVETGAMVTDDLGFEFTNLAPPILAEPLVDFGILGVPVVGALVGLLLSRLDRAYWDAEKGPWAVRVIDCIYPFWLGCVLFLTRGGSFASLTFTTAFTAWILPLALGLSRGRRVFRHETEGAPSVVSAREDVG